MAARNGNAGAEVIRIWAPLCENLNLQDEDGLTPLHLAAGKGYVNKVTKILAPLEFLQDF